MKFSDSMNNEDIPKIKLFFTSQDNSFGIIDLNWVEGDEYSLVIDPREKLQYNIDFKTFQYDSLKLLPHECNLRESFYRCMSLG